MYANVLAMVLAGGEGRRLRPLTQERAKPAVPFGGRYRLIDFALSNFVNSGFYKIKVLTQYKSNSLNTHLNRAWRLARILDQYIEPVPAQQNLGPKWYEGSADAIYQNLNIITDEEPEYVCVFGADHVYKMDVSQMLDYHVEKGAVLTVAGKPVPIKEASAFGVIQVDENWQMIDFTEKPENPSPIPGNEGYALVSMGNYIFDTEVLVDQLRRDADTEESVHDFGRNIITGMYQNYPVYVYDFDRNEIPGQSERERGYWRDVGTIDAYYQANMDLIAVTPVFDMYNKRWPIRTHYGHHPPAKFVHSTGERIGVATNSMVADGCIISGGRIDRSILFPTCRVHSFSHIDESILFEEVEVGRHARIRNAIIDKGVTIPPGAEIGFDLEKDRQRFHVDEAGHVVVPKEYRF